MSYYDIDDILSTHEKVPCTPRQDIIKVGHLDNSSEKDYLQQRKQIELPLWMASKLLSRNYATVKLPKIFTENYRHMLLADPTVANLHDLCPFFYRFGLQVAVLTQDLQVADMLQKVFQQRYQRIMDSADNTGDDATSVKDKLDNLERELYALGTKSKVEYRQWLQRQTTRIRRASSLARKRKRTSES